MEDRFFIVFLMVAFVVVVPEGIFHYFTAEVSSV